MLSGLNRSILLSVGITVLLWGSAFAGVRVALQAYSPAQFVLFRTLVGAAAFALLAAIFKVRRPRWSDLPLLASVGVFGVALYQLTLSMGQMTVSAGGASFLVNLIPVLGTVLATFFLKERLSPLGWGGVVLGFFGVTLIALGEGGGFRLEPGAGWILLTALCGSIHLIVQKPLLRRYTALEVNAYAVWLSAPLLLIFSPGLKEQVISAPLQSTLTACYLGVFPGALAYITWSIALARVPVTRLASALYLIPCVALVTAFFWIGEVPALLSVVGGLVTLASVGVVQWSQRRHRRDEGSRATGEQIRAPASAPEWAAYYDLRWRILRAPWGQPRGSERDEAESEAIHRACFEPEGLPRAVGRLHFNGPDEAQVRFMAVDPAWRGRGWGGKILRELEQEARRRGACRIVLNARAEAARFYGRHGYREVGPAPALFGIPHLRMQKLITECAGSGPAGSEQPQPNPPEHNQQR